MPSQTAIYWEEGVDLFIFRLKTFFSHFARKMFLLFYITIYISILCTYYIYMALFMDLVWRGGWQWQLYAAVQASSGVAFIASGWVITRVSSDKLRTRYTRVPQQTPTNQEWFSFCVLWFNPSLFARIFFIFFCQYSSL